jgi:hypothetical protein
MDYLDKIRTNNNLLKAQTDPLALLVSLTNALSLVKPNSSRKRDIIEKIIKITPQAGKISSVHTIESLGRALLWVNNDYITPFATSIMILQKKGVAVQHEETFAALEHTLMVCYCKMLTKNYYGTGAVNNHCIEWQREFFSNILNTVITKEFSNPYIAARTLKLSSMITEMNDKLLDINENINVVYNKLSVH